MLLWGKEGIISCGWNDKFDNGCVQTNRLWICLQILYELFFYFNNYKIIRSGEFLRLPINLIKTKSK